MYRIGFKIPPRFGAVGRHIFPAIVLECTAVGILVILVGVLVVGVVEEMDEVIVIGPFLAIGHKLEWAAAAAAADNATVLTDAATGATDNAAAPADAGALRSLLPTIATLRCNRATVRTLLLTTPSDTAAADALLHAAAVEGLFVLGRPVSMDCA